MTIIRQRITLLPWDASVIATVSVLLVHRDGVWSVCEHLVQPREKRFDLFVVLLFVHGGITASFSMVMRTTRSRLGRLASVSLTHHSSFFSLLRKLAPLGVTPALP